MAVLRSDLSVLDSNQLNSFVAGTKVPSLKIQGNDTTLKGKINTLTQYCIDNSTSQGENNTFTGTNLFSTQTSFALGIKTDLITSYATNGDIVLTTTSTGVFKYGANSATPAQVLTVGNFNTLIGTGSVAVMTGATSGTNGAAGLAPQPVAGEQNEALFGDATYRAVLRSTVDTLNTGAMAAGKTFVGTGANATAPAFVPTIGAAMAIGGSALSGKSMVASSASAGTWDYVITTDAAFDLTGTPTANQVPVATNSSTGVWTTVNATTFPAGLVCDGRLTLTTGLPVTTSPVTAATTVYFTPFLGSRIALYDGTSAWNIRVFAELSVAVPATTVTPFDIFVYDNAGTATLETANWTNDTTRATALTLQNGVYVKTGALTRRYLGTGRTTGVSGQTQLTASSALLWNYYNRRPRSLNCVDATNTWTYTTNTWRAANASNTVGTARVEIVVGVAEDQIFIQNNASVSGGTGGTGKYVGVGLNSITVNSATAVTLSNSDTFYIPVTATYEGYLAAGYNYISRLEIANVTGGTATWQGTNATDIKSAMTAKIFV